MRMTNNIPLSKAAKIIMGQSPPGDTYNDRGIGLPLLNGPTEFGPTHPDCSLFTTDSRRECEPGDLIFCVRGSTTGRMNWADKKYSLGRGVCSFRSSSQAETKFVRYCIQYKLHAILQLAGGGTFPTLTKDTIECFEISWPDQRVRIAGILSAYDELIENSQRRIKILESMARALYREWFVHFRFPGHESIPKVNSPLGEIPQGWEVRKLGEVLELNYGKALKQENRHGGHVPVFGSSGIVGQHDVALVKGPGIIVGRKGNVGSVFWSDADFYVIDTAYYVTAHLPLRFLFYVLPTLNFINSDAAVPGLNRNQANTLEILVPPAELLEKFCSLADTFEQRALSLQRQIQNLRRTRDLLLPRLLSGQIDVEAMD